MISANIPDRNAVSLGLFQYAQTYVQRVAKIPATPLRLRTILLSHVTCIGFLDGTNLRHKANAHNSILSKFTAVHQKKLKSLYGIYKNS